MTEKLTQLFSLNPSSGIPIFRQLIDQIKQAIRMKLLSANEQLPSVRTLATKLQINPMTISKAFAQLEIEGVLVRKRGVGMIVAEKQKGQTLSQTLEASLLTFIQNARRENMSNEEIFTLVQQYISINQKGIKK